MRNRTFHAIINEAISEQQIKKKDSEVLMKTLKVRNYHEMSVAGAVIIHEAVMEKLSRGEHFNLGLATGNTMIELYEILAEMFNDGKADLSGLQTWNLDEYAVDEHRAVPHDHPLSYWKYMHENLFNRFQPERNFRECQAHFPDPSDPGKFDRELSAAGELDLQLLGIGFNGHIAFNERGSFADLRQRLRRTSDPRSASDKGNDRSEYENHRKRRQQSGSAFRRNDRHEADPEIQTRTAARLFRGTGSSAAAYDRRQSADSGSSGFLSARTSGFPAHLYCG